jgi:serine/threonine protein kinase
MARKRFTIRSNFSHELRNLKILQSNDLRHDRIMMSLGSVTVGEECNLLFNWAELDLEKFLRGKPLLPGLPTQGLSPHPLLAEVTDLAGALDFLHRSIWMEGTLQSFCHMDLKPNNILVMGNHTSPIGRWKITDFGISNLEASSNVASTRDLWMKTAQRTSNQSPSIRYPGPYQPPEAEPEVLRERVNQNVETPGYKSDVWSFGCVVLAVLVFSIGGPRYFRELENQLSQESLDCDGVDRAHRFYRNVDGKFQIHTFISSWLPLISGSDLSWVAKAWDYLARKVLRIDPINRVSAFNMREELHSLTQQAPRVSNWNPASIIPIPPFPPEGQRRRSTRTRSELFRLAVTSAITSGPGLPQRPNHSTGTRDRHGDTVINRDSRLLVLAQNPSLVPHIQINEPSNASSPPTIFTPVSTSQSQESSLTTWSTRGGASSNLAHDLYMQQNVKIASGGQRIVFWNDSRAKAYNRSTEPNSLFTTDMARTFPPNGSTTTVWDDVLIAGDFLALRKRPRQRSPGIVSSLCSPSSTWD